MLHTLESIRTGFRMALWGAAAVVAMLPCMALATEQVLLLDGETVERVITNHHPALNPVSAITIEAWVRPNTTSGCQTIVGKGFETAYWLGICNGKLRYYVNGQLSSADGNITIPSGEWSHVAVTFDGERRRYYVNGELDIDLPWSGQSGINARDLGIGGEGGSSSYPAGLYPFTGRISEVRLWSYARSQLEIRDMMYQQLTEFTEGQVAIWPLNGSASERFGYQFSYLAPGASFSSIKSPPLPHTPLVIRGSSGIFIDGKCSDAGYSTASRVPAWYPNGEKLVNERNPDEIYLAATGVYLFVCFPSRAAQTDPFWSVELDINNDGGDLLETDDYRFQYWPAETGLTTSRGTQTIFGNTIISNWGSPVSNPQGLWAKEDQSVEFSSDFEMRIPRSILTTVAGTFRIRVTHNYSVGGGERSITWPPDSASRVPSEWQEFRFDLTPVPEADSVPPRVFSLRIEDSRVTRGDGNSITAKAADEVDVELVEILVDGNIVHSEEFPGASDNSVTTVYAANFDFSPGRHYYTARAYDQAGLIGEDLIRSFRVEIDAEPPGVGIVIVPRNPAVGQPVTVTAIATDPTGISNIRLSTVMGDYIPSAKNCDFPSGAVLESCSWSITPDADMTALRLKARATDSEGFADTTGDYLILWGNSGLDSDDDGLSDAVEKSLCTNHNLPDSDFDGLSDGWEVKGVQFRDGQTLPLPDYGVNPCWKDILLQLDYEPGASPEGVANLQSQFRDRQTRIYVEQHRRPIPTAYDQSHIGSIDAVYQQDDSEYYFDPARQWAFYYGYHRNLPGDSGAGGRFFTIDASAGSYGSCQGGDDAGESCRGDWECSSGMCGAGCALGPNMGNACTTRTDCPAEEGGFWACSLPCVTLPGAAGPSCGRKPDKPYRLLHELGHSMGMGHGGMKDLQPVVSDGGFVTARSEWNHQNFKPHQVSAMNYLYNQGKVCMLPIPSPVPDSFTPELVGELTFMDTAIGTLDETSLSESPSSTAATGLQEMNCDHADPGAFPVYQYTCTFDDVQMQVLTDGIRTVARSPKDAGWSLDVPSHAPGIDWNCNGVIDVLPVSENIDGPGRRSRSFSWDENLWVLDTDLEAREEFPLVPKPLVCQSLYKASCENREQSCYVWPEEYRNGIPDLASGKDMVDCRELFLSTREEHEKEECRGGSDAEFLTVTCPVLALDELIASHQPLQRLTESESLDWVAGPLGDAVEQAEEGERPLPLLAVEQCDGSDNDGDGKVDENCRDTDNDSIPDAIDNCPVTSNTNQADADRDGLGDACQFPTINNLQANWNGFTQVDVSWTADDIPSAGVAVYRSSQSRPQPEYRGSSYPSSTGTQFTDSVSATDIYTYSVRPINVDGREGEPVSADVEVTLAIDVFEDSFEAL